MIQSDTASFTLALSVRVLTMWLPLCNDIDFPILVQAAPGSAPRPRI